MLVTIIIALGVLGALGMVFAARGPSSGKVLKRRIEMIKERHGDVITANAQAQIRKLFAQRASKVDGLASQIIPKPALLRKRLEQTGREITLGKYAMVSLGLSIVVAVGLMMRGMPFLLCLFAGLFVGIGLPHFIIGKMIIRRVNKVNVNFPDAIELMVLVLRPGP